MDIEPGGKPNVCNSCTHYYITHDASFMYGCRALDFKSQRQPILVVIESSEQQCHFFQKKESAQK